LQLNKPCLELSADELKTTNGCGSSYPAAWIFRIPKWLSNSLFRCCNRHDIKYQLGMSLKEKHLADDELLDCIYYSAYHGSRYTRYVKTCIADIVYLCLSTKLSDICFTRAGKQ